MNKKKFIKRELVLYELGYPLSSDIIEMMEFIESEIGKCIIYDYEHTLKYKHKFYHITYFIYYKNSGNFFIGAISDDICEKYNVGVTKYTYEIISTLIKHILKLK